MTKPVVTPSKATIPIVNKKSMSVVNLDVYNFGVELLRLVFEEYR